jgi:hypothetical protein
MFLLMKLHILYKKTYIYEFKWVVVVYEVGWPKK